MKQQRFSGPICALVIVLVTSINSSSYAGNHGVPTARPQTAVPRAFLALDAQSPSPLDPAMHISAANHDHTMETLARISVVGGLLLTADRLFRSVDSPLLLRDDGSCVRINAANNGFLVGFTMSRPLDF